MDRATRTIIYNQLEILKHLDPQQADSYSRKQRAVEAGYTSRYDEVCGSVVAEEASEEMQAEVWDTLDMFRALRNAQQKGWTPSNASRATFEGFDANNDDHYFFASHLIDDCGLYQEEAPNKNSHSVVSAPRYRRMVAKWKSLSDKYNITTAEAEAIIAP